jgi:hypothetical protein
LAQDNHNFYREALSSWNACLSEPNSWPWFSHMFSRRAVETRPTVTMVSEGKKSLSMSGEKEYLDAALDGLLTAISRLEVGGWYAVWEAAGRARAEEGAESREPSSVPAPPSFEGKDKVANPNWEDIPFNPVPITPLSSKPHFAQVVGSSSEAMAPPRPTVIGAATVTAAIRPPGSGGCGNGGCGGGGNGGRGLGGGGCGDGPPGSGNSPSRSNGNGNGS